MHGAMGALQGRCCAYCSLSRLFASISRLFHLIMVDRTS